MVPPGLNVKTFYYVLKAIDSRINKVHFHYDWCHFQRPQETTDLAIILNICIFIYITWRSLLICEICLFLEEAQVALHRLNATNNWREYWNLTIKTYNKDNMNEFMYF